MFRPRRWRDWLAIVLLAAFVIVGGTTAWWVSRYGLAVHRLTRGVGDTIFHAADGRPWFRLDEQRHDVPLPDIAPDLQHAVIAVEDRRFYYHPGIDPIAVTRAVVRDVREGAMVEGGSTLTQQLARTLFLSNARTFGRKAKEAVIAALLEARLTKSQILELYLNRIYLSAGVYGVETMSQHLFRKPAKALTLAESALVAGLIRAPSALSPWSNYEGALTRSHLVLSRMRDQKWITAEQEEAARSVRPRVQPYRQPGDTRGVWAKEYLRQRFREEFGGDHPPDWRVETTFSPAIQEAAERAVEEGVRRLNVRGLQAAFVAIDPTTGDVRALVGGVDFRRSTFNRAVRGRRQAGSAFKPLLYAAALAEGYSPVSVIRDLRNVRAPGNPDWDLQPAGGIQPEELTLRAALTQSNNAAAAELQRRVGSQVVLRLAGEAGLSDLPDVPSLALGAGSVSPLELTAAYTIFPGGGELARPRGIAAVFDADGDAVVEHPIERRRIVSAPVAFQMVSMLRDVVDRGTGNAARALGVRGPIAGKTGTTDEYRDAWFVGFSTAIVAGVWVGLDQPAPIGRAAYAAQVAVPIWADFMKRTAKLLPAGEFVVPPEIESEALCSVSFRRPVADCPLYTEYFKPGDTIPSEICNVHRGTFQQRAARAVSGFFKSLGSRIAGIFRR